jgi:5-methylcytosine-specific restriction protein A
MAKSWAIKFYNSKKWKKCRESYIQTVGGLCERCFLSGLYNPGEIVHHTIALSPQNIDNPHVTLNHENLEYLCQDCHNAEHIPNIKNSPATREGTIFNSQGELIKIN